MTRRYTRTCEECGKGHQYCRADADNIMICKECQLLADLDKSERVTSGNSPRAFCHLIGYIRDEQNRNVGSYDGWNHNEGNDSVLNFDVKFANGTNYPREFLGITNFRWNRFKREMRKLGFFFYVPRED